MDLNTLLEIFLFLQVFIAGILVAIVARHLYAHYREPATPEQLPHPAQPADYLPPVTRQHLQAATEEKFQQAVNISAHQLQQELTASGEQIKGLVNRLATEIVADEMERYRQELSNIRGQAHTEMAATSAEVAKHKEEIKQKITQEMEAEKQKMMKQIDTKLADAVVSFLTETLQHNVDLGSQAPYLVSMLEEHKADFIKGVEDETASNG